MYNKKYKRNVLAKYLFYKYKAQGVDIMNLSKAILIAVTVHKNQKDKVGAPYILHPLRVMLSLETTEEQICGVLHDVIEDTSVTLEDLESSGFEEEIIRE